MIRIERSSIKWVWGAIVVACIGASGCADSKKMYEGARLPGAREVRLYGRGASTPGPSENSVRILSVDGERAGTFLSGKGGVEEVYLAPGRHTVTIQHALGFSSYQAALWFEALSGHEYAAKVVTRGYRSDIWIEDAATGERVSELSR